MKKTYMLTQADDLRVTPSEVLQEETLEKMRKAAGKMPSKQRKIAGKRMLICSALVCAMFMLMGAGYRVVTNYMTYVVGQGIVTQETENIYTLGKAAYMLGEDEISAVSMVPVTEGEHAGQWEVTVMTSRSISTMDPYIVMYLQKEDGTETELLCENFGGGYSIFKGYMEQAEAGMYTILWADVPIPIEIVQLGNSQYAEYTYPVSDGISVICFPIAEGSDVLVMHCTLTPQSANMKYWLQHAESVKLVTYDMYATDTNGKVYYGRVETNPADTDGGDTCSVEAIYKLNAKPSAPIAKIQITEIYIELVLKDMPVRTLTIPAAGETVAMNDRYLVDTHGVKIPLLEIAADKEPYSIYQQELPTFSLQTDFPQTDFAENITFMDVGFVCTIPEDPSNTCYKSVYQKILIDGEEYMPYDWKERNPKYKRLYVLGAMDIAGYQQYGVPLTYGDRVNVVLSQMVMTCSGNWTIDFTAEKDTGIPKEAIKYR